MVKSQQEQVHQEIDPLELSEKKRHPLYDYVNENSKFFLMKAPNEELLIEGIKRNEWPLINKTAQ